MKDINAFWHELLFLQCDRCEHKFAVRNGFYTVAKCPNCEKYVTVHTSSGENPQRIDNLLSDVKKTELINIYYYKKLESKLLR